MNVKYIMIIDDHPLVVRGFQQLIEAEPNLEICCSAGKISDAVGLMEQCDVKQCLPDLVIVDISLPDGNGLEFVERLLVRYPDIRVLVSSMHDELIFAERALRAGAKGFINKQEAGEKIIYALRQVLDGKIYLSHKFDPSGLQDVNVSLESEFDSPLAHLSNRELEVFGLIGLGMKTSEIAHKLNLSIKTIESHRANIKSKLRLENSNELVRSAVQWSLAAQ